MISLKVMASRGLLQSNSRSVHNLAKCNQHFLLELSLTMTSASPAWTGTWPSSSSPPRWGSVSAWDPSVSRTRRRTTTLSWWLSRAGANSAPARGSRGSSRRFTFEVQVSDQGMDFVLFPGWFEHDGQRAVCAWLCLGELPDHRQHDLRQQRRGQGHLPGRQRWTHDGQWGRLLLRHRQINTFGNFTVRTYHHLQESHLSKPEMGSLLGATTRVLRAFFLGSQSNWTS